MAVKASRSVSQQLQSEYDAFSLCGSTVLGASMVPTELKSSKYKIYTVRFILCETTDYLHNVAKSTNGHENLDVSSYRHRLRGHVLQNPAHSLPHRIEYANTFKLSVHGIRPPEHQSRHSLNLPCYSSRRSNNRK